jgi:hypothetical protein
VFRIAVIIQEKEPSVDDVREISAIYIGSFLKNKALDILDCPSKKNVIWLFGWQKKINSQE